MMILDLEVKAVDINVLKTISNRLFGIYSQFKNIVSDLEENDTIENRNWARALLSDLSFELNNEANCLIDFLRPPQKEEKDETEFKIDGIIYAERNPMSEDEFFELFLSWAEENKLTFCGTLEIYKEEIEA